MDLLHLVRTDQQTARLPNIFGRQFSFLMLTEQGQDYPATKKGDNETRNNIIEILRLLSKTKVQRR
jgi:hypothetical protein